MSECRRLVQEQVLYDDDVHRPERVLDVMDVGVGLRDVFAVDEDAHERSVGCGIEHVGNAEARLVVELQVPFLLEDARALRYWIRDDSPGYSCGRRAHVARALHVVLASSGFTPTPSRPMLPVAIAMLAIAMTIVEPWLCSVTPRP